MQVFKSPKQTGGAGESKREKTRGRWRGREREIKERKPKVVLLVGIVTQEGLLFIF